MINGARRKLGQTPVASPRDRFCARSALLPMRKRLPAAPKGRRLDLSPTGIWGMSDYMSEGAARMARSVGPGLQA
jgi:hypothetical protein